METILSLSPSACRKTSRPCERLLVHTGSRWDEDLASTGTPQRHRRAHAQFLIELCGKGRNTPRCPFRSLQPRSYLPQVDGRPQAQETATRSEAELFEKPSPATPDREKHGTDACRAARTSEAAESKEDSAVERVYPEMHAYKSTSEARSYFRQMHRHPYIHLTTAKTFGHVHVTIHPEHACTRSSRCRQQEASREACAALTFAMS